MSNRSIHQDIVENNDEYEESEENPFFKKSLLRKYEKMLRSKSSFKKSSLTKIVYEVGTESKPNKLYYQTLRLYNEKLNENCRGINVFTGRHTFGTN